jgi:beta-phosphoglucomutase-like phosphatase (HAD superfamily)
LIKSLGRKNDVASSAPAALGAPASRSRRVGLMFDLDGISLNTVLPQSVVLTQIAREFFELDLRHDDFGWTVGASGEETISGHNERFASCELRAPNLLAPGQTIGQRMLGRLLEIRRPQEQQLIDVAPMPGFPELLDFADKAELPRSNSTSRPEAQARELLRGTALEHRFDVIVGRDSEGVSNPKPAPDVFLRSAELLGIVIKESWAIEDSKPGVYAARAAGSKVLYVPDSRVGSACSFAKQAATHTVSSLDEAREFLERELGNGL